MSDQVVCGGCRMPKASLKQTKLNVYPGVVAFLCGSCIEEKIQPREFVVLAGQQFGLEYIKPYLNLYYGKPIIADELI